MFHTQKSVDHKKKDYLRDRQQKGI